MGRPKFGAFSKAAAKTVERPPVEDVTAADFLANRRALPNLIDVAPDPVPDDPAALCDLLRAQTARATRGPQPDVRLLVDDGERHLALATAVARTLRCDVYLTPDGAQVRCVRESLGATGDLWDAIAVDRATGEPADWLVVRPEPAPDVAGGVPVWFTTVRGRLRQNNGLVSVALPGGIAFATRNTFRDAVYLAGHLRKSASRVSIVVVSADLGRFEISRFDDAGSLLSGVELATLVGASLDLIHPDVQLALTWPTDVAACAALDVELMRFADALNRTVWVPRPQGAAFMVAGCGEFAAVDEVGGPSEWQAYPARLASAGTPVDEAPRYRTDPDGRLVPLEEPVASAFPGVPFVSVPGRQLDSQRRWYESAAPSPGLFAVDLGVLTDGRLGVLLADGAPLAVGPRVLRALLRDAGWSGEDLVLLAQPPIGYWEVVAAHARSLTAALTVDVWLPAPGADIWARPEGGFGAHAPGATGEAWRVIPYGRAVDLDGPTPGDIARPAALVSGPRPAGLLARQATAPGAFVAAPMPSRDLDLDLDLDPDPAGVDTPSALVVVDVDASEGTIEPVGVTLARVQGAGGAHAVPWLPPTPVVNSRAIDLYLWTPLATDEIEAWGLPSADLFLLAGQDPLRLAERRHDGYLLRVHAPQETAIDLLEHVSHAPADVRRRVVETGCTHMLPLAWLSDLRVTARFDLDGRGGVATREDIDVGALAIRFEGAEHGVPGLPNEVVQWPVRVTPSYLLLPDEPVVHHQVVHRGYVPLSRRKPTLENGHRLLEIKVPKRRAIDVPATLDSLGGLPVVGRLHDFVGLDLLLPADDLPNAGVSRIWRQGPTGKPVVDRLTGETLSGALALPSAA